RPAGEGNRRRLPRRQHLRHQPRSDRDPHLHRRHLLQPTRSLGPGLDHRALLRRRLGVVALGRRRGTRHKSAQGLRGLPSRESGCLTPASRHPPPSTTPPSPPKPAAAPPPSRPQYSCRSAPPPAKPSAAGSAASPSHPAESSTPTPSPSPPPPTPATTTSSSA